MWQRFSSEARRAVFHAQEVAQKHGEGYVDSDFLFLGVIEDKDNEAVEILRHLSISSDELAEKFSKLLPPKDHRPSQDMTLTTRAKRVIDLAYSEARDLNDNYIGTGHLLLGLVVEGNSRASKLLSDLGATGSVLRDVFVQVRAQGKTENGVQSPEAVAHAADLERQRRDTRIRVPEKYSSLLLISRQNLSVPRLLVLIALADHDGAASVAFAKAAGLNHKMLHYMLEQRMLKFEDGPSEVRIDAILARASEIAAGRAEALNSAHVFFAIFDLKADPYLQELIGDITLENLVNLLDEEQG